MVMVMVMLIVMVMVMVLDIVMVMVMDRDRGSTSKMAMEDSQTKMANHSPLIFSICKCKLISYIKSQIQAPVQIE